MGGAETPKSLIASAAYAIESAMVKNCLFWGWSSINMRKTIEILALWELIKELENHFINTRKKTQQNKYATRFGKEGEIVIFQSYGLTKLAPAQKLEEHPEHIIKNRKCEQYLCSLRFRPGGRFRNQG